MHLESDIDVIEPLSSNTYLFKGEKQEFEIILSPEDSFEVSIEQIKSDGPIELKSIDKVPACVLTKFDDVEEYEDFNLSKSFKKKLCKVKIL